jgi:hypothetical protein
VLPERPVVDVTSVAGLPAGGWTLVRDTLLPGPVYSYMWELDDIITGNVTWTPMSMPTIAVTYSHGFQVIPKDLRGLCLSVAARMYVNPSSVEMESVGRRADPLQPEGRDGPDRGRAAARRPLPVDVAHRAVSFADLLVPMIERLILMTAVTVTTSPITLDSGSTNELLLTNTGAHSVYLARGAQVLRLRPGAQTTVQSEGAAVTAYTGPQQRRRASSVADQVRAERAGADHLGHRLVHRRR